MWLQKLFYSKNKKSLLILSLGTIVLLILILFLKIFSIEDFLERRKINSINKTVDEQELLLLLNDQNINIIEAAIERLGEVGGRRSVGVLISMLNQEKTYRWTWLNFYCVYIPKLIIFSLQKISKRLNTDLPERMLMRILENKNISQRVRWWAASWLKDISNQNTIKELKKLLIKEKDEEVKSEIDYTINCLIDLPEELIEYLRTTLSYDEELMRKDLGYHKIDLNSDGIKELIVIPIEGRGASWNGPYWLFKKIKNKYQPIGEIYGQCYFILSKKTNGYRDIITCVHESAYDCTVCSYFWDGLKYALRSSVITSYDEFEKSIRHKKVISEEYIP